MRSRFIRKAVQFIHDERLGLVSVPIPRRISNRIFARLFQFASRSGDPLVQREVAGFKLWLPFSHALPFILQQLPQYSSNLARIAKYTYGKYPDLHFIDIGANVGDTVAMLRREATFPILCIEGSDKFFSILKKNTAQFSDVCTVQTYVGETTDDTVEMDIEEVEGTAHLRKSRSNKSLHIKKLSDILSSAGKAAFQSSKMLKIDTDGYDCKILRGAADFLSRAKPVVFFEYDPFFLSQQEDRGRDIFERLQELGYYQFMIYDNRGDLLLTGDLSNQALIDEIHLYYSGRGGLSYCDICVFHAEDQDVFLTARQAEMEFFSQNR